MTKLGAPERPLLAFGTEVQAKNREWKRREHKAWGPRTVPGRLLGPAPNTLSAYVVLLRDNTLYVSSSVYPLPDKSAPAPRYRHVAKGPLGSIRALLALAGGESILQGGVHFSESQVNVAKVLE